MSLCQRQVTDYREEGRNFYTIRPLTASARGWNLTPPFQAILPIRRISTDTEADPDDPGGNLAAIIKGVMDGNTGAVKKALDTALAVAEKRHGLTGAYSPHSLRYAWAQDVIRYYLEQGFGEK